MKHFSKVFPTYKKDTVEQSVEDKINSLNISDKNRSKVLDKLKIVNMSNDGAPKAQKYVDGFLKIPFNKIRDEDGLYNPEDDIIKEFKLKFPTTDIKVDNTYTTLKKLIHSSNNDISELSKNKIEILNTSRKKQSKYLKDVEDI